MFLTALNSWKKLEHYANDIRFKLFTLPQSTSSYHSFLTVDTLGIQLDINHQKIDDHILHALVSLANERNLKQKIQDLFQGKFVNQSEQRPALHTALRAPSNQPMLVNGIDVSIDVLRAREHMYSISEQLRSGLWLGYTGKPIQNIVNIGIGGSSLGPRFCLHALKKYCIKTLGFYFISEADPDDFINTVEHLNPETTLFIVASKSFTTIETLYNAQRAMNWLGRRSGYEQHFIAVTENSKKALSLGYKHILPIWNWVGGRYSIISAINLITAIAIGPEQFGQFLLGAYQMDQHFLQTEFQRNLPVLLGLIGIWNINFLHLSNLLMLTYAIHLEYFVPYIQQLDMESNGKSIDMLGKVVNYNTGPIVWGGSGNQAHHSYYQLLCQGTHKVALDLITLKTHENELCYKMLMEKKLMLTQGNYLEYNPEQFVAGGLPINHIQLKDISPNTVGQLIALYEHKIYTQSVIWGINPFDQPGVEQAKKSSSHVVDYQI